MSVTVTFSCGGCDAKAEGTKALRKRFQSLSGRDYGIGGPVWDVRVEDVVPEGWIAFDPWTYCCYCPKCWAGIIAEPTEPALVAHNAALAAIEKTLESDAR